MNWSYLKSEALQTRYKLAASYVQGFEYIVEIGGYLTPITNFIDPAKYRKILSIDPLGEQSSRDNVLHLRVKYQDIDIFQYVEPKKYALIILGLDLEIEESLISIVKSSARFIVEYPIDLEWQRSHEEMLEIINRCNLSLEVSVDIDCSGNDFGNLENSYPPRTSRRFNVFRVDDSKRITPQEYLLICGQKNYQLAELSNLYLVNPHFMYSKILPEANFAESHDALPNSCSLGTGILYYSLASSLKAKVCVCLGSGGGFVPRMMRQAQRDNHIKNSRTILIDADMGNYGRPNYMEETSFLRRYYPDIEILKVTTKEAVAIISDYVQRIDYLHVDADHSLQGSYEDFRIYSSLCDEHSIITFHDTRPFAYQRMDCWKTLELIRREGHKIIDMPWIGGGVALVQLHRENQQLQQDVDAVIVLGTNITLTELATKFGIDIIEVLMDKFVTLIEEIKQNTNLKLNVVLTKEFIYSPLEEYKLDYQYCLTDHDKEIVCEIRESVLFEIATLENTFQQRLYTTEMSLMELGQLFSHLTINSNWTDVEIFLCVSNDLFILVPVICRSNLVSNELVDILRQMPELVKHIAI